jgi:hypothetical protein
MQRRPKRIVAWLPDCCGAPVTQCRGVDPIHGFQISRDDPTAYSPFVDVYMVEHGVVRRMMLADHPCGAHGAQLPGATSNGSRVVICSPQRIRMQDILDHINRTVRPALRAYLAAEQVLTAAQVAEDEAASDVARGEVMRAERTAATELHHLADHALHHPPPAFADIAAVRAAVQSHVLFLREPKAPIPHDVALLRDTAEAFKHFKLDRASATVADADAVATISTGYGVARWGEGKWGGRRRHLATVRDGKSRELQSHRRVRRIRAGHLALDRIRKRDGIKIFKEVADRIVGSVAVSIENREKRKRPSTSR